MAVYGNMRMNQKIWTVIKANNPSIHCFHSQQLLGENFNKLRSRCVNGSIVMCGNYMKQSKSFSSVHNPTEAKIFEKPKLDPLKNTPQLISSFHFVNSPFLLKLSHSRYFTAISNFSGEINVKQDQLIQSEKCYSSKVESTHPNLVSLAENTVVNIPKYLHFHLGCTPDTQREIISSFQVLNDYVSDDEEDILIKECEPHLKRLPYEFDHWDDAIHGFRETERSRWGKASSPIISRMRQFAFPDSENQIQQIHILDLAKTGVIKPHVDSIRFCGNIICGLCLLSDAVMRLVHVNNKDQIIDILLPRRSLYLMKDESRYNYTHEVLGEKYSYFNATPVPRERRVSVICRNNPRKEDLI